MKPKSKISVPFVKIPSHIPASFGQTRSAGPTHPQIQTISELCKRLSRIERRVDAAYEHAKTLIELHKFDRERLILKILKALDSIATGQRVTARTDAAKWAKWFRGIANKS